MNPIRICGSWITRCNEAAILYLKIIDEKLKIYNGKEINVSEI